MSSLSDEVQAAVRHAAPGLSWIQKASLTVAANVVGLVLGAIVIAAGSIVWNKAMATDDIKEDLLRTEENIAEEIARGRALAAAERKTILEAVAYLQAEHVRFKAIVTARHPETAHDLASNDGVDVPILLRDPAVVDEHPPAQQTAIIAEPSAADVQAAQAELQGKIDAEVYREKNLRD